MSNPKGIELILLRSDNKTTNRYYIPKDHDYVYIDPIGSFKMDSPHAQLKFSGPNKIQLRDCLGKYQTYAKGKDRQDYELVTNTQYRTLRDGDLLKFGSLPSSTAEFRVKLLYTEGTSKMTSSRPTLSYSQRNSALPGQNSSNGKNSRSVNKGSSTDTTHIPEIVPPNNDKIPASQLALGNTSTIKKSLSAGHMPAKNTGPSNPKVRKSNSHENGFLAPLPNDNSRSKRRRWRTNKPPRGVGALQSAEEGVFPSQKVVDKDTSTLPTQLEIPCSSDIGLGCGYNALTGSFTSQCAIPKSYLRSSNKHFNPLKFDQEIIVLDASSSILSANEIGLGVGAQISADVKLEGRYKSFISAQSSVSSVVVKYWVEGSYDWEKLKPVPPDELLGQERPNFSDEYGDYYVSAVRRKFGHWVIMAFQLHQANDVEVVKGEIKARLSHVLDLGVKSGAKLLEDQRWSRQHVLCGGYGYPADILKSSASVISLQDALKFLDDICNISPTGETRAVKLTRYPMSTIITTVPKNAFQQFREMQKTVLTLDLRTFNPAIRADQSAHRVCENAVKTFSQKSDEYFKRESGGDPVGCRYARKEVQKLLLDAMARSDLVIARFTRRRGLIIEAKRLMEKGIRLETPHDGRKSNLWEWRCGMTGSFDVSESTNGAAYTSAHGTFQPHSRNYNTATQSVRRATWWFTTSEAIVGKLWPVNKRTEFRYDEQQAETKGYEDSEGFKLILGGRDEIYIIGWSVLCEYVDKDGQARTDKNGRPFTAWIEHTNASKQKPEAFLPHLVAINVNSTRNIKCTFEVFFVLYNEYCFDLY